MSLRADTDPAALTPTLAEAIAQRVAELLRTELGLRPRLLTPSEVAEGFAVSRTWVYEHADELGAIRLGDGPKARLRFDAHHVTRVLASPTSEGVRRPDPLSVQQPPEDLLPVYGRTRAKHSSD